MLIRGSCRIAGPCCDAVRLEGYLRDGQITRLRRRLEADAKSLFAYYQYGRLHGGVRLRWGFLDELIPVRWAHRDEPKFYDLKRQAHEQSRALEVVFGSAPGWAQPWSRVRRCMVRAEPDGHWLTLVDEEGFAIDDLDVQLARLVKRPAVS